MRVPKGFDIKAITVFAMLSLISCSGGKKNEEALTAHNTVVKVKEEWSKVEKPLTITILDRDKAELEAIGSIGVFLTDSPEETAKEFHFDGESFKPLNVINVDSTVTPIVFYPFHAGLHLNDSVKVDSILGPRLLGIYNSTTQTTDNINVKMTLKDVAALLRLKIKSDNITDVLDAITIQSTRCLLTDYFRPTDGKWCEVRGTHKIMTASTGYMANDGRDHDFYMQPSEDSDEITIEITINDKDYKVSTIIPPMREGSITELRLSLVKGKLNIGSSWVDTKHPFTTGKKVVNKNVQPLQFLKDDGTITPVYDTDCIAMVIETDGTHGKAVALKDSSLGMIICGKEFSTGVITPTVDGRYSEGCFNPNMLDPDYPENVIAFNPGVRYSKECALGYRDGGLLTSTIIANCGLKTYDMFKSQTKFGTAYIPTVYELFSLSYFLTKHIESIPSEFVYSEDFYTTCCESSPDTYYAVTLMTCCVSSYNSKRYPNTNLRLFYLF